MVIKTLEQAKKAVDEFNALLELEENSDFGSADSEPARNFEILINRVIYRGKDVETYLGQENYWELFSLEPGWKKVSNRLTSKARQMVKALEKAPYPVVREFLDYYGLDYDC